MSVPAGSESPRRGRSAGVRQETGTGEGSCLPGQLWGWGGDQDMGKARALSTTQIPGGQKVVSLLEVGKQAQRLSNLPKVTQLLLCIARM